MQREATVNILYRTLKKAAVRPHRSAIRGPGLLLLALLLSSMLAAAAPVARTITLSTEKQPLSIVLASISKQTGVSIATRGLAEDRPIAIDVQQAPFWKALDAIAAAAGARVDLYDRSGRLTLVPRVGPVPPVSYDGPFRATLRKLSASRDLETGGTGLSAAVEIAWEPHLEPLFLESHPRQITFTDGAGRAIPVSMEGSSLAPVDGKLAATIDVPLPAVPRSTERIGKLAGALTAIAPSKMLTLDFGPLDGLLAAKAGSPERQRAEAGTICTLTDLKRSTGRVTVQLHLKLPKGGPSLESYQSWVVNNEMFLQNEKGERRKSSGYFLEDSSSRAAVLSYHFTDKEALAHPESWRLVYRTPASIVELSLRFSFADVPLP